MLYPVELPVHSEEIDTMSLAINQVNAFEKGGEVWCGKASLRLNDGVLLGS